MSFSTISGAGVSFGESIWGEPFSISGQSYTGTIEDLRATGRIVLCGNEETADLVIVASRAQFASAPLCSPRSSVTVRGFSFKISGVGSDELTYTLTCKLQK